MLSISSVYFLSEHSQEQGIVGVVLQNILEGIKLCIPALGPPHTYKTQFSVPKSSTKERIVFLNGGDVLRRVSNCWPCGLRILVATTHQKVVKLEDFRLAVKWINYIVMPEVAPVNTV